jgi:DnaJ family protein C protein 9
VIPFDDDIGGDSDDDSKKGPASWKSYFDLIFGKLSTTDIDQFALKYKMSDEEEKDVLENYQKFKGNLTKMLEYVMLSEERDVPRWVEDYIRPAIDEGSVSDYSKKIASTLATIQKKLDKERKEEDEQGDDKPVDDEETETEESSGDEGRRSVKKKKMPPKKAKPTKAKATKKKKSSSSSQLDLIAAIRNKKRGNPLAALGARYGVSMDDDDDDDPLDDDAFAKIQSKFKKRK